MKVVVKRLVGTVWQPIDAQDLEGLSIADWLLGTREVAMGAIYNDEDKPYIFITNSDEWASRYRTKGFCMTARELKSIVGTTLIPDILLEVFPDGVFMEATSIKE